MLTNLLNWIEESVIPRYDAFDKGHQQSHVRYVMETALSLASHYNVDLRMIAVAAACHDLGLEVDRKTHHLESGRIIREMKELKQWFDESQIETIAQAAEDHRASSSDCPRSIYGMIIAEADRQIIPETVIRRTIQYGLEHYPELVREGQWNRTVEHLHEKYAENGYLKLWIPESENAAKLEELRCIIRDKERLRQIFDKIYSEELSERQHSGNLH
ncbi:MAG: HD domain-containing protein [Bacteroidaceae bacterium]|nr:HD domain-containing protein [Bacteroidaceae bacterium]